MKVEGWLFLGCGVFFGGSDIAYWSKEFGVSGDKLHEAIRSHGTHVDKIRAALSTAEDEVKRCRPGRCRPRRRPRGYR